MSFGIYLIKALEERIREKVNRNIYLLDKKVCIRIKPDLVLPSLSMLSVMVGN